MESLHEISESEYECHFRAACTWPNASPQASIPEIFYSEGQTLAFDCETLMLETDLNLTPNLTIEEWGSIVS